MTTPDKEWIESARRWLKYYGYVTGHAGVLALELESAFKKGIDQGVTQERERDRWRPIATAPRDGTTIFGCDAKMANRGLVHFNERGEWEMVNGLTNWPNGKTFNPTHWFPLPPQPSYLTPPPSEGER